MLQEAEKNILGQKLLLFSAIASAGGAKEMLSQIMTTWDRLLSVTYGVPVNSGASQSDQDMLEEYEKMKNLRPEFKLEKNGSISIKGLDSFGIKT